MLQVGITGGIGSGKSTVCRIFELLDVPIFYADDEAKRLMNTDAELVQAIKTAFGARAYTTTGALDRPYLAQIVFADQERLATLNQLVHPATLRAFSAWVKQQSSPYVLKEAAILYESGSYLLCDYTILVQAPENLRIQRVARRDGSSEASIRARMSKQMPEAEKARLADFFITNDGTQALIPQVLSLHRQLVERANDKHTS